MQLSLYDTTLRDGAQTEGISFSAEDKLRIAERLDAYGVHYIEGGFPGSNPKDREFFTRAAERTGSMRASPRLARLVTRAPAPPPMTTCKPCSRVRPRP